VVQAEGLVRTFGGRRAVDGVSFTLQAGDCLALFGPNGAGKTTLLRMLAGLLAPGQGSVRVNGVPVKEGAAARAQVGLVSHASMLYSVLTARENVEFAARLYGLPDPRGAAMRALELMRVDDRADAPARTLSRGLQQRVSIARAMVHAPRLLLCDEPYTGLDDAGVTHKAEVVRRGLVLHRPERMDAIGRLAALGGFEIAAIAGLILGAAELHRVVVLDGFISCSAALVVRAMEPAALDYVVYSHRSAERGHRRMLEALGARPLLDLDMRLGEGTGAAIGISLVESAVRLYREMATFESAGVSTDVAPPPESRSDAGL